MMVLALPARVSAIAAKERLKAPTTVEEKGVGSVSFQIAQRTGKERQKSVLRMVEGGGAPFPHVARVLKAALTFARWLFLLSFCLSDDI